MAKLIKIITSTEEGSIRIDFDNGRHYCASLRLNYSHEETLNAFRQLIDSLKYDIDNGVFDSAQNPR